MVDSLIVPKFFVRCVQEMPRGILDIQKRLAYVKR